MAGLLDFLQAASNAAASNVSGPVDAFSWLLNKAGVPVSEPVAGSDWMKKKGLTRDVRQSPMSLAGETVGLLLPIVAAAKAPQIASGILNAQEAAKPLVANAAENYMARQGLLQPATVWHGSPHKFDKFDASKIGTGEGAQAYGHGLYLAESPNVAKSYQNLDPTVLTPPVRAFKGAELTPGTPEYHAATLLDNMGLQQARKTVAGWIKNADPRMAREAEGWAKTLETLNAATSKADFKQLKNTGNLYKVDLPDSMIARMLDWDKPLSQQAPEVQKAAIARLNEVRKLGGNPPKDPSGEWLHRAFHPQAGEGGFGQDMAAKRLRESGVPGIKYFDQQSRNLGQGTRNYVVFPGEENMLKILSRNGQNMP